MKHAKDSRHTQPSEAEEMRLAKGAFERVRPRLDDIPSDRVLSPKLDLHAVAIVARGVSRTVDQPDVRRRLLELPKAALDPARLDELRDLSLAMWHARTRATTEHGRGRVPPELTEKGVELRERMVKVIGHCFDGSSPIADELRSIKGGNGHQDLAVDLTRLADVYEANASTLERDGIWYREDDAELARAYQGRIMNHLEQRATDDWPVVLARLWTLLWDAYEEVRAAGRLLFRREPLGAKFVSLYSATRARPHAREEETDETVEPTPAPVTPPAAPAAPAPTVTPTVPVVPPDR